MADAAANRALIARFYEAFGRGDGAGMVACYAPDVHFRDPAFGDLHGEQAGAMWKMLTSRPGAVEIALPSHDADEETGTANWIARYEFTQTGRDVVNDIQARFRFRDGLIVEHIDDFSFWKWSRQALGPIGLVLGWTPLLGLAFRRRARGMLAEFEAGSGPS